MMVMVMMVVIKERFRIKGTLLLCSIWKMIELKLGQSLTGMWHKLLLFSCSVVSSSLWPRGHIAHQASLSFTVSWRLLELVSIESVMPSNHLILCCPLLFLQYFPASGLFWWVSPSHQMTNVLELQLQHQSFQWISVLISFRIDWFDLLAIQGTLKSLLQHHSDIVGNKLSKPAN